MNNEIIRSNVRYHKTLSDVQSRNEELAKEMQQLLLSNASKDTEIATLKVLVDRA